MPHQVFVVRQKERRPSADDSRRQELELSSLITMQFNKTADAELNCMRAGSTYLWEYAT